MDLLAGAIRGWFDGTGDMPRYAWPRPYEPPEAAKSKMGNIMKFRKAFTYLLIFAPVVMGMSAYSVPANAEYNWFRDFIRGKYDRRTEEKQEKTVPVSIPKVKAPSYYHYKADVPVRIGFSKLIAALAESGAAENSAGEEASQGAVSEPVEPAPVMSEAEAAFRAAAPYLEEYVYAADKAIADAIIAYYSGSPRYIWVTDGKPNPRARVALNVLKRAQSEGLDPDDYFVNLPGDEADVPQSTSSIVQDAAAGASQDTPVATPEDAAQAGMTDTSESRMIRFEMAMSARVLRYARDLSIGRVNPNRLSGYHDLPVLPFDGEKALAELGTTSVVASWLSGHAPRGPHYDALKRELAEIRASVEDQIVVDGGLFMKPGSSSPEFAKIMKIIRRDATAELTGEFGPLIDAGQGSETYAAEYAPLIKAVQKSHGLAADGIIGRNTVNALSPVSRAEKITKVELALERLRWLPHDLGPRRVFVNQPEYIARYYSDGEERLAMRVIVGKPSNQTSFFYDEIEKVDFNPYWGVPRSIIVNEMLPRLLNDPGYLDRAGYEVTDSRGRRVSSATVDWGAQAGNVTYDIRQTPGEANALGELKILFPNKHAIYMHDTPSKSLFGRDTRAFSHGCIRLQQPREMAAAVLGTSVGQVVSDLAKGHHSKPVPVRIPVYVSYFTAWPDKDGKVGFFDDVYGRDNHLVKALEAVRNARDAAS